MLEPLVEVDLALLSPLHPGPAPGISGAPFSHTPDFPDDLSLSTSLYRLSEQCNNGIIIFLMMIFICITLIVSCSFWMHKHVQREKDVLDTADSIWEGTFQLQERNLF